MQLLFSNALRYLGCWQVGHRWARWVFQLGWHIQVQLPSMNLSMAIFFPPVVFNLCSVHAGLSMGCFPPRDGPPEEDLFADPCSSTLFYRLVQGWCVPPRHLPATVVFWDSQPSASLPGCSTTARKDLTSLMTSMDSERASGLLPPLSKPWAKCS